MKITQAILPVAGLGTRFLPWTKVVPKELLPLGNRPIIAHLVDECLDAGVTDICFVISRGKEAIPQYFQEDPQLREVLASRGKDHLLEELQRYDNVRFHTVYQDQQRGDGHALLQAAPWIKDPMLAVLFGDDMFTGSDSALQQLLHAWSLTGHAPESAFLALENVAPDETHRYGIIAVDHEHDADPRLKKVKSMVEKPASHEAPSTLGIVGRYLIPRSTFDTLPKVQSGKDGEIRLIDALIHQLPSIDVYGYECKGTRVDTGHPEGYRDAVKIFGDFSQK